MKTRMWVLFLCGALMAAVGCKEDWINNPGKLNRKNVVFFVGTSELADSERSAMSLARKDAINQAILFTGLDSWIMNVDVDRTSSQRGVAIGVREGTDSMVMKAQAALAGLQVVRSKIEKRKQTDEFGQKRTMYMAHVLVPFDRQKSALLMAAREGTRVDEMSRDAKTKLDELWDKHNSQLPEN